MQLCAHTQTPTTTQTAHQKVSKAQVSSDGGASGEVAARHAMAAGRGGVRKAKVQEGKEMAQRHVERGGVRRMARLAREEASAGKGSLVRARMNCKRLVFPYGTVVSYVPALVRMLTPRGVCNPGQAKCLSKAVRCSTGSTVRPPHPSHRRGPDGARAALASQSRISNLLCTSAC